MLLIWPSFGMNEIGTVYFNPSPPLRGRINTTAKVPGGDFSAATCSVPWPGLAPTDRQHHAIGRAGAGHAFALVEHHGQFARLGVETLQRVLADADADRQERAEPAVHAGQKFDPLLRRLGAGRARTSQRCEQQQTKQEGHGDGLHGRAACG